ncbi:MAG: acyltransferase [Muribaculaceae bacterium]|nr:acyltransferase [Muribaculaceae bacterium]
MRIKLLSSERTFVMGCAMILVMFYHAPWLNHPLIFPLRLYGLFGVDIFFFLSGYGIAHALSKNDSLKHFAYRRTIRLVPSCLLIGALAVASCHLLPTEYNLGHPNWLMLISLNRWFIVTLIIYYALSPLLLRSIRSHPRSTIICTYACSILLINVPLYETVITWSAARLPVYVLGLALGCGVWSPQGKQWWALCGLLVAGLCLRFWLAYTQQWYDHQFWNLGTFVLLSPGIIALTQGLSWLGNYFTLRNKCSRLSHRAIVLIGTCSLEIYLCHEYLYSIITTFSHHHPDMSGWYLLGMGLTMGILTGILLHLIVKRLIDFTGLKI